MWLFWDVAIMQEYTEEFREITKGSKSKEALPAGSITLINQRPVGEDLHVKFCLHVTHKTRQSHFNCFPHNSRASKTHPPYLYTYADEPVRLDRIGQGKKEKDRRHRLGWHATAFNGCPSWPRGHPGWVSFLSF